MKTKKGKVKPMKNFEKWNDTNLNVLYNDSTDFQKTLRGLRNFI